MRASDSPGVRANVLADRRSFRAARGKTIHSNLHVGDHRLEAQPTKLEPRETRQAVQFRGSVPIFGQLSRWTVGATQPPLLTRNSRKTVRISVTCLFRQS